MTVTPQGSVFLCQTNLINDYKNQLTFKTLANQTSYFDTTVKRTVTDYTYLKQDNIIKVGIPIDEIIKCNYLFYVNTGFTNKRYYCFINKMEYINENCTAITIETDCYQTWLFDISFKRCFVEREHVNDDTIGLHTVPENLETGEYICNNHILDTHYNSINDFTYVLSLGVDMHTIDLEKNTISPSKMNKYNGIVSGTTYYRTEFTGLLQTWLEELAELNQLNAINGLFMVPAILAPYNIDDDPSQSPNAIKESTEPITYTTIIPKQTSLNGYTPKNNKLLTSPFNYLIVSNNQGGSQILHYEDFSQANCMFEVNMAITPGCSIRMVPLNFKGVSKNDDYGINLGKFPICSYNVDMYTNWLTQNSVNTPLGTITSDNINAVNVTSNFLSNALDFNIGGTISAFGQSQMALMEQKQHNMLSGVTQGNLNSGDVVTSSGTNTFHFYKMSVRREFAQIIDNYFDLYGYRVNIVKYPNIFGRQNWNFIKTIGCNLEGDIPQDDLIVLRNMFDNGVTLWHNPANMYNYDLPNGIV